MANPFEEAKRKKLLVQIDKNTPTDVLETLAELSSNPKAIDKLRKNKAMLKMLVG